MYNSVSSLSLRERARVRGFSGFEFDPVSRVGVSAPNTAVSSLSLGRGLG